MTRGLDAPVWLGCWESEAVLATLTSLLDCWPFSKGPTQVGSARPLIVFIGWTHLHPAWFLRPGGRWLAREQCQSNKTVSFTIKPIAQHIMFCLSLKKSKNLWSFFFYTRCPSWRNHQTSSYHILSLWSWGLPSRSLRGSWGTGILRILLKGPGWDKWEWRKMWGASPFSPKFWRYGDFNQNPLDHRLAISSLCPPPQHKDHFWPTGLELDTYRVV